MHIYCQNNLFYCISAFFTEGEIKGAHRGEEHAMTLEVKRRRGQQLGSVGLKLTSSFYKGPREERRGEESERNAKGLLALSLLLPYLPQQNREGEGVLVIKHQTFPHSDGALPCQCIFAFLPSSFCLSPPPKIPHYCNKCWTNLPKRAV